MGLKLGADVPFCLRGGTMLAQGIGEELSLLPDMPHCWVVLCKPPFAVSTREVYQEIDSVPLTQRPDTDGMIKALESCDYKGVCDRLMNVMETVTATKRRQIGEIRAVLRENGADATLMSGSGPTVYGLFSDRIAADAIVIGPQTAAVTKLRAARPQAVGADRVANAVAAETFYGAPAIVVDFGTATNIDVIDEDGYYIGGAIAPGIRISMDALAARAAKLASVPLEAPEHAIGRDTEECIKVGAVMGAAAMAEGLVTRMKRELGREDATVIATGGLAGIVADSTDAFDVVDGQLTIKGICEIYRRMQELG